MGDVATTLQITETATPDNPIVGDLHLVGGNVVWLDGFDAARTAIAQRLRFQRGSYFLDQRQGLPYLGVLLRKNPNLRATSRMISETIASVPGVLAVDFVRVEVDRVNRHASVEFSAQFDNGRAIQSEDFGPLLLEV